MSVNRRKSMERPGSIVASTSARKLPSKLNENVDSLPVSETLTVICRFRSFRTTTCIPGKQSPYVFVDPQALQVNLDAFDQRMYTFDRVFDTGTCQADIFRMVENVVDSVMNGFNGTILACKYTD